MTRSLGNYNATCRFSNYSMSNSQMKCPLHVQLDTRVRKLPGVELFGAMSRHKTLAPLVARELVGLAYQEHATSSSRD